jgi:hypothetical protein
MRNRNPPPRSAYIFGGGVIIPSSKVSWIIKSDYKYGLTAILNDGYLSSDSRYLRLMVGVRFGRE